jgi:hypothetical protein
MTPLLSVFVHVSLFFLINFALVDIIGEFSFLIYLLMFIKIIKATKIKNIS